MNKFTFFIILILFFNQFGLSQNKKELKIKLLHADNLYFNSKSLDIKRLIGNVKFKHGKTILLCDSAYMYEKINSIEAFGKIIIKKDKNTTIYAHKLQYSGNTKLAKLTENVKLIDSTQSLYTDNLIYNTELEEAKFICGGRIISIDKKDSLYSDQGTYYSRKNIFFFKSNVYISTSDFIIITDTLEYHAKIKKSYILGITKIKNDSTTILCNKGWIDNIHKISRFENYPIIINKNKTISGKVIKFNQKTKIGKVFNDVIITDTNNKIEIHGEFARYNNQDSTFYVTENLELIKILKEDSFFLHADTLFSGFDQSRKYREILAYSHVKFFKEDMQGVCNSIFFNDVDSTIKLMGDPILWLKDNQITGDDIIIKSYENTIEQVNITKNALVISEQEQTLYNQIKGHKLNVLFDKNNDIKSIFVTDESAAKYYVKEDDNITYIGLNHIDCENMKILMKNSEIDNIIFYNKPIGKFFPMDKLEKNIKFFRSFKWFKNYKPQQRKDIFNWIPK